MDYTVHGVAKSQTRLSDFHFHSCTTYCLPSEPSRKNSRGEKDRRKRQIEGEEKIIKKERNRRVKNSFTRTYCLSGLPGWLSGKESTFQCRRCGFHPWFRKILWKRKWQPTPVFLLGESHGQRSLAGYRSMGSPRAGHM